MRDFVERKTKSSRMMSTCLPLKGSWQYPGWLQSAAFHMSAFSGSHADCHIVDCLGQSGS